MSEEMKLEWAVAFALRGDALDWWISWKESHPNTCWWNFVKAILKKFQPEVWDCLLESENESQKIQDSDEIQEPISSPTEEKIGDSLKAASEAEVQRSDGESASSSQAKDSLLSVFATIPKMKSRNKKFPPPVPLWPQQLVTKGLSLARKYPISFTNYGIREDTFFLPCISFTLRTR
ncbi:hypothetical protein KIW84_014167 [Lathyrus oleraceus]|uniref:Retrotransposon gag domain-containing protein n=1 Tax=Pisum sativum TaxID=3888 RepID=A0A9D5GZ65_PEA|nr:hypothetical protein KIW84_014167 [Pisum sativum]